MNEKPASEPRKKLGSLREVVVYHALACETELVVDRLVRTYSGPITLIVKKTLHAPFDSIFRRHQDWRPEMQLTCISPEKRHQDHKGHKSLEADHLVLVGYRHGMQLRRPAMMRAVAPWTAGPIWPGRWQANRITMFNKTQDIPYALFAMDALLRDEYLECHYGPVTHEGTFGRFIADNYETKEGHGKHGTFNQVLGLKQPWHDPILQYLEGIWLNRGGDPTEDKNYDVIKYAELRTGDVNAWQLGGRFQTESARELFGRVVSIRDKLLHDSMVSMRSIFDYVEQWKRNKGDPELYLKEIEKIARLALVNAAEASR